MKPNPVILCLLALLIWSTPGCTAETSAPPQDNTAAFDTPPAPLTPIAPVYPETARHDGAEGKVLLKVQIGADGVTQTVTVLQSVRPDLDTAARQAVEAVRWTPARKAGQPVAAEVVVPVMFKLADKSK